MDYVKRLSAAVVLAVLVAVSVWSAPVSAHVLQTDNGVSAILHIKPDDNPIAGKAVPINFLFSNDVGGFSLNRYEVQLSLIQDGAVKFTAPVKPLFFGSATEGETMGTFPRVGVYTVRAAGKPTDATSPAFTLNFTVRVADAVGGVKKGDGATTILLCAFSVILLVMIATKLIQNGGKYRSQKTSSKST